MLNIFRKIPHPHYGNWGGASNTCIGNSCPMPVDWMDSAFKNHDNDLRKGDRLADHKLGRKLQKGSWKGLKVKPKIYAVTYYWMCRYILFRPKKIV